MPPWLANNFYAKDASKKLLFLFGSFIIAQFLIPHIESCAALKTTGILLHSTCKRAGIKQDENLG